MKDNAYIFEGEVFGFDSVIMVTHLELYTPARLCFNHIQRSREVRQNAHESLLVEISRHKLKYVVGTLEDSPFEMAVVFSEWINHVDMAHLFTGRVIGAGFVYFKDKEAHPYGESVGLRIRPSPTDHAVLRWALGDAFWKRELKRE